MAKYFSEKQIEDEKVKDNRRSLNHPLQPKGDSFVITSANNSFARDYADNDWYSSRPIKVGMTEGLRKAQITPKNDSDQHMSKVYTRGSDMASNHNDQSRYHRRIASEDLILEENSDINKID